jgi:ribosomal protein S18 acetylase RimI-like enzyme
MRAIVDLAVDLATAADEPEIRRLLRDNPMDGAIRVSLEREPDAFLAAAVEGAPHYTVVARDPRSGAVVGMGSRSVWNAFVNGEPRRLGYLSQLRVDRAFRGRRRLLAAGYAVLRDLRGADETPFDVTSIIADNEVALRFLGARVPGLPRYRELAPFVTLILPTPRPRRPSRKVQVERGSQATMKEVADCLARNRRRYQVAPFFTAEELLSPERSRGLAPESFLLAMVDGRLAGCLALWDQSGFKQVVVRDYAPRLARWRPWINRLAPFVGTPRLPDPGSLLPHAYVSHLAVDDDDPTLFQALIEAACADARAAGYAYLVLGLAAGHPWLPWLRRRFRAREYPSILYTVHWDAGESTPLDDRLPHVEAALL